MNSLGQFSSNRITIAQRVLKGSSEGTIAAKAPPPFRDTRGANHRLLSSEDIANQWIRFGMPPAVVYSAYFANTRYTNEATAEALEVAYKLLQRSQDTEKKCSGWEFISKGSRFVKVFASRCPYEDATMGLFMDKEIYDRLDELWIVLSKGHFPEPFDDRISAAESEAKIRNMKQRFRGTPSFNTDPSATSWLAVTRTAEYFKVMDELTKVNPKSPSDNDSYLTAVKHMVEIQMRHLGHALRYHNEQNPSNQIILQDVMKDVIAFETNQPRGRSAAQNHFLCLLALGTTVERHKTSARGDRNLAKIAILSEVQFSILKAFDIPQGILIGQGYNVSIADEGARYTEKERRHACHSSLKDFTTTMTETQGGTGGDMHNFDNWDVPLTFNDGRLPNEVDFWNNEEPSWIHDDTSTGPSAQSASSPPEGPQPQASQQPQASTIQPKKMPRSSTGGGASSSTHAAFRSGPGTTPQDQAEPEKDENWTPTEDWMKRKRPSTVEVRLHAAEDYAHQEQRIAFLRSGRDFVLSTIEGPHTTHKYGTNLIWKQYLRRLTFHAALSFNMLTEGQLDSHMINESDYEWLKLYHHIITSTEFVRCKGYPVTEVLAMLTLGIEDTVEGEIRNKLKKLGSKIGQFIIGKPWMDRWDELGGQVRNNKSLILTDLTYQTRSSSRIVHDIEAGLNNMGLSSIKVYQLPYESLEKPEEFLKLATEALTFLRTNTATFTSVTIHIWISFASLFRGQNRMLVPNADFIVKLAGIITEISQEAPLPIFVNILKDARFLGSQSSILSIADDFARILKEKGIMHSTNERFWKQIYACGHEPFYWKEGEGKEVVWAMLEKSLMRQKVFLHCAMDHDTVHDLNEECVHVKNTGFDIETIKRCTEHPRIIPSIRTGDTKDAQTGSADIIGGMSHMKDSVQRRAWSDIRRGVFTPEPLTDVDEHWVEVTEDSELMCDVCKGFHQNDSRMGTCTENRTRCLNCASNWTRSAIYGTEAIGMDEFSQDARVAARLLNIYNECVDWRNMEAEKDLRGFLITATLAMLSGYKTTSDVLKQVSHRGAIRMPAYMVKGKCRRDLLPQFTVQRETRTQDCGSGTHKIRWFYRLLWDGGNVAYHDYMKTVLTKEEIESMFPPTATAEYIGDIFEFWLGMLDLGIQFPTMFGGWGANLDSCLAGLEESFWLYSSSCRPTDTINTKRNRSRKAYIPLVENEMVTAVLREAGIFNLLLQKKITRMPVLPAANYDDHPEMVEVSSSDEEMDEVDEPEEETTSSLRREALERSRLREKLMPEAMTSKLRRMKRTWGANPRGRRSAELRYGISVINLRSWLPTHRMFNIASFVVECMTLMSAPHQMTRTWETHCGAWDWSWTKSQNPHPLQKDPKPRQEAEKTNSRRTSCHRGNDGEGPDMLLQPAGLHVRHWWSWRRRTILSEWHRSQPLWPRCEKSSWAWCTCWTSSWGISTCAAYHWRAECVEPQRSWCIHGLAQRRKKTTWRQLEFQVHPTIHTWPQHRYTSTCSHQWRRISWLWMEWCETIWWTWMDGEEMGKPTMDSRTIKEIQCSATPLRGLRQRQSRSPWTTMRWSRLGQCRSNLEVWQHLER